MINNNDVNINIHKASVVTMKNRVRHLNLEIKSFEEDGTFDGYGSVFGVKDSYGDIVVKGAFMNSLVSKMPKLLWQHRTDMPIGIFTSAYEDAHGLRLQGKLALDTVMGKDAYALLKMGAIDGLSIGYYLKNFDLNKEEKTVYIKDVDLLEVSLVTFPANVESQVESVKTEFLDVELNKAITDLIRRVRELEAKSEMVEGSTEDVGEEQNEAEAETHEEDGEDDGAEDKADKESIEALNKLLATLSAI